MLTIQIAVVTPAQVEQKVAERRVVMASIMTVIR
jgi:hypothetical protein